MQIKLTENPAQRYGESVTETVRDRRERVTEIEKEGDRCERVTGIEREGERVRG